MKCIFCNEKNEKIITVVEEKLKKCKQVLRARNKFNLEYNNINLLDQMNTYDGYHRQCYSSFTAVMTKYRNISDNNSSSSTYFPMTSYLLPNTAISVSETVPCNDDCSNSSITDFCRSSSSTALLPNTPICVSEIVSQNDANQSSCYDINIQETSYTIGRVCFFCEKIPKQEERK